MATNYNKDVERVSEETLKVLATVSSAAESQLREPHSTGPTALASVNTFTSGEAIRTLGEIDGARRRSLEILAQEPAIARVVTRTEEGKLSIYYICRDTPVASIGQGKRLAGRNSPAGRLASLPVGEQFKISTPGGGLGGEIVEKAILRPHRSEDQWDSRNSVLEGESYGPITIVSLRDQGCSTLIKSRCRPGFYRG